MIDLIRQPIVTALHSDFKWFEAAIYRVNSENHLLIPRSNLWKRKPLTPENFKTNYIACYRNQQGELNYKYAILSLAKAKDHLQSILGTRPAFSDEMPF